MQGIYLLMSEFKKYNHPHYYLLCFGPGKQLTRVITAFNQYNHTPRQALISIIYRWEDWSLQKWFAQRHIAISIFGEASQTSPIMYPSLDVKPLILRIRYFGTSFMLFGRRSLPFSALGTLKAVFLSDIIVFSVNE